LARDRLLAVHRELLERFRTSQNLVGPGPLDVHYEDARQGLAALTPSGRWADVGTGAGFPGLVLAALHPHLAVDLVDSRSKRCWFLEEVLARAGCDPGVRVRCARVEALGGEAYDGVTARAVAEPGPLLDLVAPIVAPGGRVAMFLQAHQEVPWRAGFRPEHRHDYVVAGRPLKVEVGRKVG
jgi:16S rRNA (guanine527-N7)-methyltransferase